MLQKCSLARRGLALTMLLVASSCTGILAAQVTFAAEEELRWKFAAGESLQVTFRQTANTETLGAGKPTSISVVMGMEMTWHINEVADDGTATMSQSFDRLTMSMKTGGEAAVDYDSAAEAASAEAREIAEAVGPLIGPKFQLRMSNRGEVLDVRLSAEAEKALAANTREGLKAFFSAEGISRVLRQSFVVFPEQAIDVGAKWKSTSTVASPLGPLEQSTTYMYAGPRDHDGRTLDQIDVESALGVSDDAARSKTKITAQSQTGTLWFDGQRGRLVTGEIEQKLTTVRPYRDSLIEVRSSSRLTTTVD